MSGKNINFDDKKIRKSTFYKNKTINTIENIDANNINCFLKIILKYGIKLKN